MVVDTTPIITLALVDRLALLQGLYGTVMIPPAVQQEVASGEPDRPGAKQLAAATWIETRPLSDPRQADLLSDLDRGEAEVITLALEQTAARVIIDERLGRRHARRLGIPLTGTLGVLLKAKSRGLVPQIAPLIEEIQRAEIRLSDALVARVIALAGES